MKNRHFILFRLTQPWYLLAILLLAMIYHIVMLIFWPWLFIGCIFWKIETVFEYTGKYFNWITEYPGTDIEDTKNNKS